jgi:hypothetical protein
MTLHRKLQAIKSITPGSQIPTRRLGRSFAGIFILLATTSSTVAFASVSASRAQSSQRQSTPIAVAARELTLHETGNLHLVSHYHEQIVETGHGTGTLSGSITVKMTLAFSHASVTFIAYPSSGGTVAGYGEGTIYAGGKTAHFTGNATISGGSGRYAHASGRNIHLEGTLQRHTFALYVKVEGKMRY